MINEKKLKYDLMTKIHKERFRDYKTGGKGIYYLADDINECIDSQTKIGEWIPYGVCGDRSPTKEECQKNDCRFILDDGNRRYEGHFDYERNRFVRFDRDGMHTDKCVIAWQPFPDGYHN